MSNISHFMFEIFVKINYNWSKDISTILQYFNNIFFCTISLKKHSYISIGKCDNFGQYMLLSHSPFQLNIINIILSFYCHVYA